MKQENICKDLNFSDCELAILRMAVDKAEEKLGKRLIQSDELKKIISIVETFIPFLHICFVPPCFFLFVNFFSFFHFHCNFNSNLLYSCLFFELPINYLVHII